MRTIKKYANRKLYDTKDKSYISLPELSKLIKDGEEVVIIDKQSDKDITASIVSQLIARDKKNRSDVPSNVLMQLLRKGSGTLVDYAKKYTSLWQSALTMAEDEIDRLVRLLVKDKELSEVEGNKLKTEILAYTNNLKAWMTTNIDQRINEVMKMMNVPTKDQFNELIDSINALTKRVDQLERRIQRK